MVVDTDNNTVRCCSLVQFDEATVTYGRAGAAVDVVPDNDIVVIRPKGKSDSDSDDYEYMESFNPLYLSIILIVAGGVLVAGLQIRDNLYSAKDNVAR